MKRFLIALAVVVLSASTSEAGCFGKGRAARGTCSATTYYSTGQGACYAPVQAYASPQAVAPVANPEAPATAYSYPVSYQAVDDGSGAFVDWINRVRASRGLRAVVWSPVLAADAIINSSRGFGHSFMGRARRQNAGWGALPTVQQMWLASPAHLDAILDPSATEVGLGQAGSIITLNLR